MLPSQQGSIVLGRRKEIFVRGIQVLVVALVLLLGERVQQPLDDGRERIGSQGWPLLRPQS
eukprot:2602614-Prymnesium_polylepis.1